jgi:hypothetical protein
MRAWWLWITTLLVVAGQPALAQELPKAAGAGGSEGPVLITVSRSVELPAMTENGELRTAKVPGGAQVQLLKVDGDRVEVLYQGLTIRMHMAMTDFPSRAQTPSPAATLPPIHPVTAPPTPPPPAPPTATVSAPPASPPSQSSPATSAFIESSMNKDTFKAAGLDKLSPAELQVLNDWFLDIILASKRTGTAQPQTDASATALGKKGNIEKALLVKNFNGERVMVQRANGEKWMLRAKTWCRWSWRYEGRYVCLIFGKPMSQLINDYGESYDFWTDKEVQ